MARVSCLTGALAELEAGVGATAAEAVDGIEGAGQQTGAEAIVDVVDAPVDDGIGSAGNEPSRASERVEAEPGVGARCAQRYEHVQGVGQRRPRGQVQAPDATAHAVLEHGHLMDAGVLRAERMEDGRHAPGSSADEMVAQRLRRAVDVAVRDDREGRLVDPGHSSIVCAPY